MEYLGHYATCEFIIWIEGDKYEKSICIRKCSILVSIPMHAWRRICIESDYKKSNYRKPVTMSHALAISSESQVVSACKEYLLYRGHFVWRNNTAAVKTSSVNKAGELKNRFFRAGTPGSADIIGIARDGKAIAVECKRHGNTPTSIQVQFLAEFAKRGGYAIVAYGIDELKKGGL